MRSERALAVCRSPRARDDLLDIWLYIAERDPSAADRVLSEIEKVCGLLATHPLIGRERPEILPGIRSLAVMSWIVFYQASDDSVEIARVLHGARDIDELDF